MYLFENDVSFGFSNTLSIRNNFVVFKANGTDNFIFVNGQRLVTLEPKSNTTQFFTPAEPLQVTSLVISQNEKFLAVSSESHRDENVKIIIYYISSRKRASTLSHKEKVTAICFSSDSRYLISTTTSSVNVWDWNKGKIMLTNVFQSYCTRLSCAKDELLPSSVVVCTSGPRYCRVWTSFSQKLSNFKIVSTEQYESNNNFIDHTWISDSDANKTILAVLVGPLEDISTNQVPHCVQIYSVQKNTNAAARLRVEMCQEIKIEFKTNDITSLNTSGFVVSGCNGSIHVYENRAKTKGMPVYVNTKKNLGSSERIFQAVQQSKVSSNLYIADTTNRNICEILVDDKDITSLIVTPSTHGTSHIGGVRDMDTCIDRPLLVTCGYDDGIVNIWNYNLRRRVAKLDSIESKPQSVAIHPSGYQVAIGFHDKLTMYHVLVDSIKAYRSLQCHAPVQMLEFSPRFLAAVVGNTINLYEVYQKKHSVSFILMLSFTGHIGPLNCIYWTNDTLFTAGSDRNLYGWDISTKSRIDAMNVLRSFGPCISIVFSSSQRKYCAACVTSDGSLHKLIWNGNASESCIIITRQEQTHDPISTVAFNMDQSVLLAGTRAGVIQCYKWQCSTETFDFICTSQIPLHQPLTPDVTSGHSITRLRMTPNNLVWSTGGVDGSIFSCVLSLSKSSLSRQSVIHGIDETILITSEQYDSTMALIDTLKSNMQNLKDDHEYILHSTENHWMTKVEDLSRQSKQLLSAERQRNKELQNKYDDAVRHHIRELEDRDKVFNCKMTEVEETHSAALLKQKSVIEQLKSEFKAANENCNAALHAAQVAFDDKAHQLKGQHEKEVNELQGRIYKLEEDVASSSKIFQELLEQQEEEYELMISNLKAKSDSHSHKEEQVKNDITASLHSIKFERDQLARQVEELKSKSLFSDESFKREHSLRRLLENEKEELICTISEMTSRTESETHRIHGLEKDVHASKSVERELKEKLQSIENSKTSMLTEIENLKNQQSTLEHEIRLRNKIIEEKDVARQRLESKLNSSNKEKQHLSNQTRAMKRELVLLAGMNEKELRTAIDGICTKYSR